ncbi:MAG: thiamine pyrophosphate-dependent dehydrogenase E1 component subunit alpha [Sulfuricaulis sp.]|nr:thiamine pyrophosphate-dependent dehydrogenase E1 component subunit alpha [Sulfuricaulis sp.]
MEIARSSSTVGKRELALFRTMCLIREFEERAAEEKVKGTVPGLVHQSTGQEAVPTGICIHLRREDYVFSNHRGHGHALAKGANPVAMMKEIFGRAGGTCGGKGGSMHIADFSVGMLGANGILADGLTMAVGAAQAILLKGQDRLACCFVGDGTTNRGPFFEALNWAQVFKLPVLFACEDNTYASTTRTQDVFAGPGIVARVAAFGIASLSVDGNDVRAVDAAAGQLISEIRNGGGPRFLHARTYRIRGHISNDPLTYRRPGETEERMEIEPISRYERWLTAQGVSPVICSEIRQEMRSLIDLAVAESLAAPFPDPKSAWSDVQDVGGPQWSA